MALTPATSMLECTADPCPNPDTIRTRNLKFKSVADYEMPRGDAVSNTNTNTYMVTVKISAGGEMQMVDVTVRVANVEEAGMVELSATGGNVGTPLTAVLTDDDIVMGPVEWLWSRVDPVSGSSVPITGARSCLVHAGLRRRGQPPDGDGQLHRRDGRRKERIDQHHNPGCGG